MSAALSTESNGTQIDSRLFTFPECTFTPVSLTIPNGMKFERWQELGVALRAAGKGVQFWIGDWIRYGEHEYGEKYSQAIEVTGREAATLQNWVYVAENVHSSRRRELDKVDFSTHAEVASLPPAEQERILAHAEAEDATVKQVRKEVHRTKRKLGQEKTEIEVLQTPAVREWLTSYKTVIEGFEATRPREASFLRNMTDAHAGQTLWQLERTVEGDCAAILDMFDGEDGVFCATDCDIFNWLQAHGYFMRDPELDDRLERMIQTKDLKREKQGGKKDTQRGDMVEVYMLYNARTGDAFNEAHANSIYSQGDED